MHEIYVISLFERNTRAAGSSDPADYHPKFSEGDRVRVKFDPASGVVEWWLNGMPMVPKPGLEEKSDELCFCVVNYSGQSVWRLIKESNSGK